MAMAFTVRVEHGGSTHSVYATGPYRVERAGDKISIIMSPPDGGSLEQRIELQASESAFVMNSQGWTVDIIRHGRQQKATLRNATTGG